MNKINKSSEIYIEKDYYNRQIIRNIFLIGITLALVVIVTIDNQINLFAVSLMMILVWLIAILVISINLVKQDILRTIDYSTGHWLHKHTIRYIKITYTDERRVFLGYIISVIIGLAFLYHTLSYTGEIWFLTVALLFCYPSVVLLDIITPYTTSLRLYEGDINWNDDT